MTWNSFLATGLIAVGLVCGGARVAAQQPESAPSRPESSRSETRPAAPTPGPRNDELDRLLTELRRTTNSGIAALRARAIYEIDDAAHLRLLTMLKEKNLGDAPFQGIVSAFVVVGDQAVLPELFNRYATSGNEARDRFLEESFRELDTRQPMIDQLIALVAAAADSDRKVPLLRILAVVTDTPSERAHATDILVAALSDARFAPHANELRATLTKITFHDFQQPSLWRDWLERFHRDHPEGFTESDLYTSALKLKDQRFVKEVERTVDRAIASRQIPAEYLDRLRYPEPAIRRYVASKFGGLRDAEPDILKQSVALLVRTLKDEVDPECVAAIFVSAGTLAEGRAEFRSDVATAALGQIASPDTVVAIGALKALGQTGSAEDSAAIEELYQSLLTKPGVAPVREQIVATLYALTCGYGTMIAAVGDPDPDVRSTAARVLAYGGHVNAAPRLGQALGSETRPEVQLAFAKALLRLGAWPDEVVASLLEVAKKPGVARDSAIKGLQLAASAGIPSESRAQAVVAVLGEIVPATTATPEKRAALLADYATGKGAVMAQAVARWLETESQPETSRELARLLAKLASSDSMLLERAAAGALKARRGAPAVILYHAALDAAGAQNASPELRAHASELRLGIARGVLIAPTAGGLKEADALLTEELAQRPNDGVVLLLRGSVREAAAAPALAAMDLRAALQANGAALGDERRDVERRVIAALLDSGDPPAAQLFLSSIPAGSRDRDFLLVAGRVALALKDGAGAATTLRTAVATTGRVDVGIVRYRLVEALLMSHRAAERAEARAVFAQLESDAVLPDGQGLQPLREELKRDARIAELVNTFDMATGNDLGSTAALLRREGRRAATFLLAGLSDLIKPPDASRPAAPRQLERRLALALELIGDGSESRPFPAPPDGAPREAWLDLATRVTTWWDQRKW